MVITNIQLGRVESDPMGIPMAASMHPGTDNTFDRLLQDSVASDDSSLEQPPQPQADESGIESELGTDIEDAETPKPDADVSDNGTTDVTEETEPTASVDLDDDVTDSIHRGEAEQQAKTAGKGTDSSRSFTPAGEPLLAATLQAKGGDQPTNANAAQGQNQTATAARSVEPTMRGSTNAAFATKSAPKAAAAQAGYSTRTAAQAQMLEQARDSVFKQIMMKMNADGGEVRMRLEPPDLGQLDLRMTVEGGNRLSLTLSADRQDINQMLHRHLEELKQALQQNGLEITGAEVQTRSEFESQQAQRDNADGEVASEESAQDADTPSHPKGFITAEGLDFWA